MPNTAIDILKSYEQKVIDCLKQSLVDNNRAVSLGLSQSITAKTKIFATEMVMEISLAKYWKFVDSGVDGWQDKHGSPFKFKKAGGNIPKKAMLSHIANRGERFAPIWKSIQRFTKNKKGVLVKRKKVLAPQKARDSLSFALGYNIKKKGFKATNFVDEAFDTGVLDNLAKDMSIALGREIILGLNFGNK